MTTFIVPKAGDPFTFQTRKGGKTYKVPRLPDLPTEEFGETMDALQAAAGDNRACIMVARDVFERHAPGSTEGLTFRQLGALSDAWATEGGEEAGEGDSSPE